MRMHLFLFKNFFIINIIYTALAGVLFPYKSPISVIIGGGFALLAIYWNLRYVRHKRLFGLIYLYSLYVFILLFFSSDFEYSLKIYLKIFTAIWLFPVTLYLVNTASDFRLIIQKIYPLIAIYLINFIVMNALGIGLKGYGDTITTGNLFSEGLNTVTYIIVLTPVLIYTSKNLINKRMIFITIILLLVTQVLTLKRISIFATIVGIGVYMVFSKDKANYLRKIVVGLAFLIALFPVFEGTLQEQIRNRDNQLEVSNLENEARFKEYNAVNEKVFGFENPMKSLFGEEVFNSQGKYGPLTIFGPDRQIHNDFSRILHDTGIIGFILYFLVQYQILIIYRRTAKNHFDYERSSVSNILHGVFYAVYIVGFILMFSGGIDGTLFQAFRYVVLGSIIGLQIKEVKEL